MRAVLTYYCLPLFETRAKSPVLTIVTSLPSLSVTLWRSNRQCFMPCPIIEWAPLESMADEEGSQRHPPFKVLDKPFETFCSCLEKEKSAPVEEKDICIPDICPICCSICSTLPPVAWRSSAAMMTTLRWRLVVTDTNRDLIAVILWTLNGSLNPNVGHPVDEKIHGDRAQLGLFSYPAVY